MTLPDKIWRGASRVLMTAAVSAGGKAAVAGAECCCGGEILYQQARLCSDDSLTDV